MLASLLFLSFFYLQNGEKNRRRSARIAASCVVHETGRRDLSLSRLLARPTARALGGGVGRGGSGGMDGVQPKCGLGSRRFAPGALL